MHYTFLPATCGALLLAAGPAAAEQRWLELANIDCSLDADEKCVIEVECPAPVPSAVSGVGTIVKASREDHEVVMTTNGRTAPNAWRAGWSNHASFMPADVEVNLRVLCSDDYITWTEEPGNL
jgi:hypothetical protein